MFGVPETRKPADAFEHGTGEGAAAEEGDGGLWAVMMPFTIRDQVYRDEGVCDEKKTGGQLSPG